MLSELEVVTQGGQEGIHTARVPWDLMNVVLVQQKTLKIKR